MTSEFGITIIKLAKLFWNFLGNHTFLLCSISSSLLLKAFFLIFLIKNRFYNKAINALILFLLLILTGGMFEDIAWVVKLTQKLLSPNIHNSKLTTFFIRISWGFFVVRYQALALLITSLSERIFRFRWYHWPFVITSSGIFTIFICLAILNLSHRFPFEFTAFGFTSFYLLFPLMLSSLAVTFWKLHSKEIPNLIREQLNVFIRFLVIPTLVLDIIQYYPFRFLGSSANTFSVVGLSTIIMSIAIYYAARKIMGLRFLNMNKRVRSKKQIAFVNALKRAVSQFGTISDERELIYITKNFFSKAFSIPERKIHLYIRKAGDNLIKRSFFQVDQDYQDLELFTDLNHKFILKESVVIADEISFDNFYHRNKQYEAVLSILEKLNADVLIFVQTKNNHVGYIVIERYARAKKRKEFYSDAEHDQMELFSTYLANMIYVLQNKNIDLLLAEKKDLKEELYSKHQNHTQLLESVKSFLRTEQERNVGIIFYKNRRFTFGNKSAHDLIGINLNTLAGHPITKALKLLVQQTLEYKTQQTGFAYDQNGKKLMMTAIPNPEHHNVIISITYPEIAHLLQNKITMLNDPSKWDYLLYLETTNSGKLINELIPGDSEALLNFKTDLLRAALSKRAVLLDIPEEDIDITAELLHNISLREQLEILELHNDTEAIDACIKLFGVNQIFGSQKKCGTPILEKLNKSGTLFIKNIHLLPLEAQELLAQFIRYGFYYLYKTDQKRVSDVRIICSTDQNLKALVQIKQFSSNLLDELNKTTLNMPSLDEISEHDIAAFVQQATHDSPAEHLLELSDKEKQKIIRTRFTSISDLKNRVQQLVKKKTGKTGFSKTTILPASEISADLEYALQLGKNALKDPELMQKLWDHFKNQNKIATFLGVNRSSVSRRFKEYKLL